MLGHKVKKRFILGKVQISKNMWISSEYNPYAKYSTYARMLVCKSYTKYQFSESGAVKVEIMSF